MIPTSFGADLTVRRFPCHWRGRRRLHRGKLTNGFGYPAMMFLEKRHFLLKEISHACSIPDQIYNLLHEKKNKPINSHHWFSSCSSKTAGKVRYRIPMLTIPWWNIAIFGTTTAHILEFTTMVIVVNMIAWWYIMCFFYIRTAWVLPKQLVGVWANPFETY